MMKMRSRAGRRLCLALACGCAFLGTSSAGAADETPRPATRAGVAQWAPEAPFTAAAAAKQGGSGVRLAWRAPPRLQPGQPALLELQFSGVTGDDARAAWRAPDGDVAGSGSAALPRGETTTVSIVVTPAADGMAYLDVTTAQNGRAGVQSVPLRVGSGRVALKPNGSAQTTPSGERVISMPSQPR